MDIKSKSNLKRGIIMTLKELCNEIAIDADVVDIYVWDESGEDYSFCFGVDTGSGDLGGDVLNLARKDLEIQECLGYEVRYMGIVIEDYRPVLRIEIEDTSAA